MDSISIEELIEKFEGIRLTRSSSDTSDTATNTRGSLSESGPSEADKKEHIANRRSISDEDISEFRQIMHRINVLGEDISYGPLTSRDISSLYFDTWVNDEIINAYMNLLQRKVTYQSCHFFNTFFLRRLIDNYDYSQIKKWTRPIKLERWGQSKRSVLECRLLFFPFFSFSHWSLIVVDLRGRTITHLDSLNIEGAPKEHILEAATQVSMYLVDEARDKLNEDWSDYVFKVQIAENPPQQRNCTDCGVFMIQFAKRLSQGQQILFDHSQIDYFRVQILTELKEDMIL